MYSLIASCWSKTTDFLREVGLYSKRAKLRHLVVDSVATTIPTSKNHDYNMYVNEKRNGSSYSIHWLRFKSSSQPIDDMI